MSQDPERLLSTKSLGPDERSVLRAGVHLDPPSGAKDEIWAAIASKLPPGGGGGPGASGLETALWKKVAIGFAMGLVGMGAAELASHSTGSSIHTAPIAAANADTPRVAVTQINPTPTPQHAPTLLQPSEQPRARQPSTTLALPSPTTQPVASVEEETLDPVQKRKSQLEDESRMLRQARTALQTGNASGALALLADSQKQHPKLILAQEHEALTIDALAASGGQVAARARAARFLELYPTSPHAEKMRTIAGQQQKP